MNYDDARRKMQTGFDPSVIMSAAEHTFNDYAAAKIGKTAADNAAIAAKQELAEAQAKLSLATAAVKKVRERKKHVRKIDAAMRMRRKYPELTDAAIADAVGCDPSLLSRHTDYQAVAVDAVRAERNKAVVLSRVEKKPTRASKKSTS